MQLIPPKRLAIYHLTSPKFFCETAWQSQ